MDTRPLSARFGPLHNMHNPKGYCANCASDTAVAQPVHSAPDVPIVHTKAAPVDNSIVSNMNQSEVIDFARRLRSRFGQGVRLTFHVEPERTQGRQPYWWGVFDA